MVEACALGKCVDNGGEPLTILHDNSFSVAIGETVAILGASGSGKSTLLALLAGLDLPSSGSVTLVGENLVHLDEDERAVLRGRVLGFVFQSFQLLPSLSGMSHRLRHYPKHLSGGEQQRVALARAFAPKPKLVLADEPTGNLDAATGHQIVELMFAINAESGTTLILVTHDEEIAARCGRRLHMNAGRIEEVV